MVKAAGVRINIEWRLRVDMPEAYRVASVEGVDGKVEETE